MNNHKVVFLNVGWMDNYQGLNGDPIKGGGSFPKTRRYGHEIFNFQPHNGRYYGYGRPASDSINLERLGSREGAPYLDNVLVVWVADSKVVGWYKHARLFREWKEPPPGSNRIYKHDDIGYYAVAKRQDGKLLERDARTLRVPRGTGVKHGMGRYIWYPDGTHHKAFFERLRKLIASGGEAYSGKRHKNGGGRAWQLDLEKRKRIETAAMDMTIQRYERWGYKVVPVPNEHLGWDINADKDGNTLLLEVKGLSGVDMSVELTPNEYKNLKKHQSEYRVCVVTNAINRTQRKLSIFSYAEEQACWQDQHGVFLNIEKRTAARLYV